MSEHQGRYRMDIKNMRMIWVEACAECDKQQHLVPGFSVKHESVERRLTALGLASDVRSPGVNLCVDCCLTELAATSGWEASSKETAVFFFPDILSRYSDVCLLPHSGNPQRKLEEREQLIPYIPPDIRHAIEQCVLEDGQFGREASFFPDERGFWTDGNGFEKHLFLELFRRKSIEPEYGERTASEMFIGDLQRSGVAWTKKLPLAVRLMDKLSQSYHQLGGVARR